MTAPDGKAWFIDAWAVHDGRVFASRRPPGSIVADATVFMSVPDLEAVPVGRISTALRATRSGFQEGLRTNDDNRAEIPFDNLRQIRDLVRRAYLAAGLGPGSPGAAAGPLPRPDVGTGPGGGFLAESSGPEGSWASVYLSETDPPRDIDQAVDTVARATVLEWDLYLAAREPKKIRAALEPDEIRGLVGWLGALRGSGVLPWEAGDHPGVPFQHSLMRLAEQYGARHLSEALRRIHDTWEPGFPFEIGDRISGYWSRGYLAVVPLPTAPNWSPLVRRLADMVILPAIDRRFWSGPRQVTSLDVAPLVLCHAIRQPERSGRLPGERSAAQVAYGRALASMTWFMSQENELPPAAEDVLAEFIDECLAGPTDAPPTGAAGPAGGPEQPSPEGPGAGWGFTPQSLPATAT